MLWFLYNLAFAVGYLLRVPQYALRMWRRGGYRKDFLERLAVYAPEKRAAMAAAPRLWIHGVSVGETFVALRLIEELRRQSPELSFLLTTTTSTGRQIAEGKLRAGDMLAYFPTDFPAVIRRALRAIRPQALILVECELWPNLIHGCALEGIPVLLVNGRISRSSYWGYRRLRPIARRVLSAMPLLLVQTEEDRKRLRDLGAAEAALRVLGTVKYDLPPLSPEGAAAARDALRAAGVGPEAPVLLGASTWPGEERALLEIFKALRPRCPGLRLVLVPRHAERREEVEADIRAAGLSWMRRTALGAGGAAAPADVLLVDTTGELRHFYPCAAVIFVGKSLTQHGGQNLIEPAAAGKPIVVGPNMENFAGVMADFLADAAVLQVQDAAGLGAAIASLLDSPQLRADYGRRAGELVQRKGGVMQQSARLLLAALAARDGGRKGAP